MRTEGSESIAPTYVRCSVWWLAPRDPDSDRVSEL